MKQEEVLKLLSRKDNRGFHYLYRHYYIALKALANYYTKNDQVADDLVQEVFISLLQGDFRFTDLNEVKHYLYTVLKNKCLNYLRDQKVQDKYYQETLWSESEMDDYWDRVLKEDVYAILYSAIQMLPPQCRQVMLMSLQGMKLTEIARQLHISLDTVKEHRSNGKKKLLLLLQNKELSVLISYFWI